MRLISEAGFGFGVGFFFAAVAFGVLDRAVVGGLGVVAMVALVVSGIREERVE